jgi:hypothetical protein
MNKKIEYNIPIPLTKEEIKENNLKVYKDKNGKEKEYVSITKIFINDGLDFLCKSLIYRKDRDIRFEYFSSYSYIPFNIEFYYDKKRIFKYLEKIDTKNTHVVIHEGIDDYFLTNNKKVPFYIEKSFKKIVNFINDDESAYVKCKAIGYILLNILCHYYVRVKSTQDRESKLITYKTNINIHVQVKNKEENLKAAIYSGIHYSKLVSDFNKLNVINNILSDYISEDCVQYCLSDYCFYFDYSKDDFPLEKYDFYNNLSSKDIYSYITSLSEINDVIDINLFTWKCDLFTITKKDRKRNKNEKYKNVVVKTISLSYESGQTIGFPIEFEEDYYIVEAQFYFCLSKDTNVRFFQSPFIKIKNYKTYGLNNVT